MNESHPHRFVLRELPIASRLVIAVFLAAVGFGYLSALVQLHFSHANSGNMMPSAEETVEVYYGTPRMSELERVLTADESKPFNGSGTMRPAFTSRSAGWMREIHKLQKKPNHLELIENLRVERDGERLALIDWIHKGAPAEDYEKDSHTLSPSLADHPLTEDYRVLGDDGKPVAPPAVKIKSILEDRCVRCHAPDKGGTPARFPLNTYEDVHTYCEQEVSGAISLAHLAQTTHVHLLGFSMLFGLTGLIFSFTSYPTWLRCIFGPFTLVVQVIDVSCWWLGRTEPALAQAIVVTGSLVAVGLLIQIVGSLFNLFGKTGKVVVLLLILAACAGGVVAKWDVIDPYLREERLKPEVRDVNSKTQAPEPPPPEGGAPTRRG